MKRLSLSQRRSPSRILCRRFLPPTVVKLETATATRFFGFTSESIPSILLRCSSGGVKRVESDGVYAGRWYRLTLDSFDSIGGFQLSLFRSCVGSLLRTERGGVNWLSRSVPEGVASTHPAWLELGGAGLMAGGFLACHISNWMLAIVLVGLVVNWMGDAATGPRATAKPYHGFFVDHSTDLIAQTLVLLGLGFSPYFTLCSALLVLSISLLISSYSYLRFMAMAAEVRLSGGQVVSSLCLVSTIWGAFAAAIGADLTQARLFDCVGLDICVGGAWLLSFAVFIVKVRHDLAQIDEDRPPCV